MLESKTLALQTKIEDSFLAAMESYFPSQFSWLKIIKQSFILMADKFFGQMSYTSFMIISFSLSTKS